MSDSATIKVGIIGYGYWGPNLVRNFSTVPNSKVVMVSDLRTDRLTVLQKNYPAIEITTSADDVISHPDIDAVVIATPVFTHYELAKKALNNGKNVLLEKPMTDTVAHAVELINLAEQKGKLLMVDHTFLYTGAVQKIKSLADNGELGAMKYFDSTRINLGLFQPDVNVLWDLAPHDISILNFISGKKPHSVNARGISHTHNNIENIAYMTVNYESDMIAHFNCSWASPVKIRLTMIGGDKKMVVYNDMEASEKVKVYDTGYDVKRSDEDLMRMLIDYRVGDIFVPKVDNREALAGMANDFISSILNGTQPIASWESGLDTVKILEASQESIKNDGCDVKVKNT